MTGVVIGLAILATFLAADVLVWNAFCRAISRMEWTDETEDREPSPVLDDVAHAQYFRAYGSGQSPEGRTGHQG